MEICKFGIGLLSETTQPDISIIDFLPLAIIVSGLAIMGNWLFRCGGFSSLKKAPVRRNTLPIYVGFAAIVLWLCLAVFLMLFVGMLPQDAPGWITELITYLMSLMMEVAFIMVFLWLAQTHFVRGLKGFGLNPKTILRDLKMAPVHLIAVYPLIIFGLMIVLAIGQVLFGQDWSIEPHQSLLTMSGDSPLILKIVTIAFAVILAPIFEEMMFRGIFQSVLSTSTGHRWIAIIATSIIFTLQHPGQHCLAIFSLSVGLGYAYERSGSLFRSIFMHMLFNSISVIGTLIVSA